MRPFRSFASRKSQYAFAVVAKPSGTWTPACFRLRTISPRDAFLPPTVAACSRPRLENGMAYG
jgi:hypothetical protein